ncbi:hypothetical protein Snoj_17870 [Streptomyces nojiriensis]|uniref:Uncharacterized protein n=1 Tax=Streptomyces nojiriensis TaxID=66374 RepID=A0ABQ3SIB9_9ACTN|nr:hypothetical protein GCM10010205_76580 [Streptomyces nojiriensis]GHI67869.1 hypothetical protein Snoj_17870 [Streptomyces nojiriensis]
MLTIATTTYTSKIAINGPFCARGTRELAPQMDRIQQWPDRPADADPDPIGDRRDPATGELEHVSDGSDADPPTGRCYASCRGPGDGCGARRNSWISVVPGL